MAAKKSELLKILELAGEFVMKQKGTWDHASWENFLKKAEKAGVVINDPGKRNLGNILEAAKYFYEHSESDSDEKPAKPKAKSAPKKKPVKKKATAKKDAK